MLQGLIVAGVTGFVSLMTWLILRSFGHENRFVRNETNVEALCVSVKDVSDRQSDLGNRLDVAESNLYNVYQDIKRLNMDNRRQFEGLSRSVEKLDESVDALNSSVCTLSGMIEQMNIERNGKR